MGSIRLMELSVSKIDEAFYGIKKRYEHILCGSKAKYVKGDEYFLALGAQ
jgi:hypothetical protein